MRAWVEKARENGQIEVIVIGRLEDDRLKGRKVVRKSQFANSTREKENDEGLWFMCSWSTEYSCREQ
ncbi:DNA-polymerase IV [Sesbania bispinosa]|nr:DNA-polymerase IV [Sesbania bispinosa]